MKCSFFYFVKPSWKLINWTNSKTKQDQNKNLQDLFIYGTTRCFNYCQFLIVFCFNHFIFIAHLDLIRFRDLATGFNSRLMFNSNIHSHFELWNFTGHSDQKTVEITEEKQKKSFLVFLYFISHMQFFQILNI